MRRLLFLISMVPLVAGCAQQDFKASGPYPQDYKRITASYIQKSFVDPTSLRDVAIGNPIKGRIGDENGWIVCLRANAKNRAGGYEGLKKTALLINHDKVTQFTNNAPLCNDTVLEPWPEMEGR